MQNNPPFEISTLAASVAEPLLHWYAQNKRDLPWRQDVRPYAVWVSEIMAQQTRIAQLLPFYERFITLFPDVETLATASLDEVLAAWAGMGYYARARNLHAAANVIIREHAGRLPETTEAWLQLPGVGAYTAGAIMSIAHGKQAAAVDGNVLRVYARLADDDTDIAAPAAKKMAADFILAAMPDEPEDVSHFSQALMELGALVCVPGKPLCESCPLENICRSRRAGRAADLPVKTAKKPPEPVDVTVLLVLDSEGRVLMRRRTEALLKGLWVYYLLEKKLTQDEINANILRMGYTVNGMAEIGAAVHVFTHRVWRMNGYAVYVNEQHTPEDYVFLTKDAACAVALPVAVKYYTEWYFGLEGES